MSDTLTSELLQETNRKGRRQSPPPKKLMGLSPLSADTAVTAGYRRLEAAIVADEIRSAVAKATTHTPENRHNSRYSRSVSSKRGEKKMRVKVACRHVNIVPASGAEIERLTGKPKAMGGNLYEKNWIGIKRGISKPVRAVTILHELLHDIDSSYSMRLSEQSIDTLATSLIALLRDNPALADLLTGRKRKP